MEIFTISVNVAADSEVKFTVIYLHQLERINDLYRYALSLRPKQLVSHMTTNIYLYEKQGFEFLEWKLPGQNTWQTVNNIVGLETHQITYSPSREQQSAMGGQEGVNGDILVYYDVIHQQDVGLIQADQGYFVHYFSPSNLTPLSKNIVFVIDISGSMGGRKIEQTRDAMLTILDQLHVGDMFKLVLFDNELEYWPKTADAMEMVTENREGVKEAKEYVIKSVKADGGTDINSGLVKGCEILTRLEKQNGNNIVFLTDGQPTSGETDSKQIQINVKEACRGKTTIHSLGFGYNLNFMLIKKISWDNNNGYVQRIYEDVDATKQLQDFYKRISSPVLFDIDVKYDSNAIDINSITTNTFAQYFKGSELVITGKTMPNIPEQFTVEVDALASGPKTFTQTVMRDNVIINNRDLSEDALSAIPTEFIEKLHVYMKIKELYRKEQIELDDNQKKLYHDEALALALEYSLVTPLTSLVIVQEDEPDYGQYEDMMAAAGPGMKGTRLAKRPMVNSADVAFSMGGATSSFNRVNAQFLVLTLTVVLFLSC